MKKEFRVTDSEIVLENAHMAAAIKGPFWDEKGTKCEGVKWVRVQDTEFEDTKEIVFHKDGADEAIRLYVNRLMRVEPHTYLDNLAEFRDLIKSRIKETTSHNVHKENITREEHEE